MRIAVIANMKAGFEQFVYRELLSFTDDGFLISVFPTRFGPGPYSVRDEWELYRWNRISVLMWQFVSLLRSPVQYLRLLREAIRFDALTDSVGALLG